MANAMYQDHPTRPSPKLQTRIYDQSELDRLVAEAYARGRKDAFEFLGVSEDDFPQGDSLQGWAV